MERHFVGYAEAWFMGLDPEATGEQLCKVRKAHHLTQQALADLLTAGGHPVTKNAISTWERGIRTLTLTHAVALVQVYECRLDDLIISYRRSRAREYELAMAQ